MSTVNVDSGLISAFYFFGLSGVGFTFVGFIILMLCLCDAVCVRCIKSSQKKRAMKHLANQQAMCAAPTNIVREA